MICKRGVPIHQTSRPMTLFFWRFVKELMAEILQPVWHISEVIFASVRAVIYWHTLLYSLASLQWTGRVQWNASQIQVMTKSLMRKRWAESRSRSEWPQVLGLQQRKRKHPLWQSREKSLIKVNVLPCSAEFLINICVSWLNSILEFYLGVIIQIGMVILLTKILFCIVCALAFQVHLS